eukprot:777270-Amorphochlora_amoeboformis.AAC.2
MMKSRCPLQRVRSFAFKGETTEVTLNAREEGEGGRASTNGEGWVAKIPSDVVYIHSPWT